ncbi:MAG: AAA family ATPase [Pseudomonadota bacterium]|nr:AAA family ATPase [Pseudomonadota bacterium]
MYISEFSLRNFRNFNKGKLKFNQGINTIIGENGSGKTNLLFALRILLDSVIPPKNKRI